MALNESFRVRLSIQQGITIIPRILMFHRAIIVLESRFIKKIIITIIIVVTRSKGVVNIKFYHFFLFPESIFTCDPYFSLFYIFFFQLSNYFSFMSHFYLYLKVVCITKLVFPIFFHIFIDKSSDYYIHFTSGI